MIPFRKWWKALDFTCSFNDGFWTTIKKLFHVLTFLFVFWSRHQNSDTKTNTNKWLMFSDKCCLAGSVFSCGLLCSFQPYSTFLSVCLMYSSPHEHLPLHITREGWGFFYFCCYPFNCNSIMVIGKCLEFLNKIFASIFVFFTIRYFD